MFLVMRARRFRWNSYCTALVVKVRHMAAKARETYVITTYIAEKCIS